MNKLIVVWITTAGVVLLFGSLVGYVIWNFMYKW